MDDPTLQIFFSHGVASQETRNGDHLMWNFKLIFFLEIVSKCTQKHQVDAKNSKIFWEKVYALSPPVTSRYIIGNAFTCDSTAMLHILAIVEGSVYPSACPSIHHSAIVLKQCRLHHKTFT